MMQKLFSMKTNNERGQAFLVALRKLMDADPRKPNQTDVVMELVFDAAAKLEKRSRK